MTEHVLMNGDEKKVIINLGDRGVDNVFGVKERIEIPIEKVFQIKRGLESYIQKFYRKHANKKTNK